MKNSSCGLRIKVAGHVIRQYSPFSARVCEFNGVYGMWLCSENSGCKRHKFNL